MGLANGGEPRLEQPHARLGPGQFEGLRVSVHSSNWQDTAEDQHQQRQESLAASGAGSSAANLAAQAPWQQQQQAARSVQQRQKQAVSRALQASAEVPVAVTPMANGLQQGAAAAGSAAGSSSVSTGDSASVLRPEPASPVTPASGMEDSRRGPFMRGLHSLRRGSQTPPASTYSAPGMAPPHSTLSSVSLPGSRLASPEAPFSHQQAASLMYGLPPGLMSGASPAGDLHRMQQHIAQLQRGGVSGGRQPRRGLNGIPLAQPSGGSPSWVQGNGTHSRGQPSIWEQSMRQQQQHALLHQQQQQGPPAPPASPGRQQAPEDTLAGDLEVLSQHLQTARICQQNKASMLTAVSPAGPAGASPPPSAAMQSTATGARSVQLEAAQRGDAERRPQQPSQQWPVQQAHPGPGSDAGEWQRPDRWSRAYAGDFAHPAPPQRSGSPPPTGQHQQPGPVQATFPAAGQVLRSHHKPPDKPGHPARGGVPWQQQLPQRHGQGPQHHRQPAPQGGRHRPPQRSSSADDLQSRRSGGYPAGARAVPSREALPHPPGRQQHHQQPHQQTPPQAAAAQRTEPEEQEELASRVPQQEAGPGQSDRPSPAGSSSSSVAGLRGAWATNSLHQQPLAEDAGQPLPPADLPAIRTAWDEEPAPQPAIRSFTDAASSSSSWAGDRGSRDGSSPPGASPVAGAVQLSAGHMRASRPRLHHSGEFQLEAAATAPPQQHGPGGARQQSAAPVLSPSHPNFQLSAEDFPALAGVGGHLRAHTQPTWRPQQTGTAATPPSHDADLEQPD